MADQDGSSLNPGGPADAKASAQVFVADLEQCSAEEPDLHHLRRVLRLKSGEVVVASDGRGRWRTCSFSDTSPWLEPTGEIQAVDKPLQAVTVGFVPVKGDRREWVVQKLVEIGVDRIVVLRSARSVVQWEGGRELRAIERLTKVAQSAAAQSRRAWLPRVEGVIGLVDFAESEPIALAERGGGPVGIGMPLCVGPEGGWSQEELRVARCEIGLGEGILRAETAAVVAGTLTCAVRDRLFAQ